MRQVSDADNKKKPVSNADDLSDTGKNLVQTNWTDGSVVAGRARISDQRRRLGLFNLAQEGLLFILKKYENQDVKANI